MLASLLIIGFSLILLIYWFRYSCMLLLRDFPEQSAAANAVSDSRFSFAEVRNRLQSDLELDPLARSLDRDYQVISYLLNHAPGLGSQSVEERLLALDYKVMQRYYRVTRNLAPPQARRALVEMSSILAVLSRRIGQQAGLHSEA
jgi:hypothetical protein